ncbi:MAG: exo-alpha-sialidase [Planctomycetes bacterium]|nr:exo-alpha-sialidase [Planctomycetota bacterium]
MNRRGFLAHSSRLAAVGLASRFLPADAGEAPAVPIKSRPDVVIHEGGYPGWPWVARDREGRLSCVFRDDSVHGFSPTGKVCFTRSDDGGRTWIPARTIVDGPDVDDRNAAIGVLPDGSLLVCYNTYSREGRSQARLMRSRDAGGTWEPSIALSQEDTRTRSAPIALASGDILVPIYRAPGNGSVAAISGDGGRTWRAVSLPDGEGYVGDEWDVLEVEPRRLIGIHRNNHKETDGTFWKTESTDGGRTWKKPVRTNIASARHPSPPNIGLHGEAVVLTYADRRMVSVSMVTTKDPAFIRWDIDRRLPCYLYRPGGEPIADGSYPCSVQVSPTRRLIVDYEISADGKRITGHFIDVPPAWGAG